MISQWELYSFCLLSFCLLLFWRESLPRHREREKREREREHCLGKTFLGFIDPLLSSLWDCPWIGELFRFSFFFHHERFFTRFVCERANLVFFLFSSSCSRGNKAFGMVHSIKAELYDMFCCSLATFHTVHTVAELLLRVWLMWSTQHWVLWNC